MINETTIRKIVDNILLNASSVNSSGLYNGKAGMALALFEAARYLKDDGIEEKAFLEQFLFYNGLNFSWIKFSGEGQVIAVSGVSDISFATPIPYAIIKAS